MRKNWGYENLVKLYYLVEALVEEGPSFDGLFLLENVDLGNIKQDM